MLHGAEHGFSGLNDPWACGQRRKGFVHDRDSCHQNDSGSRSVWINAGTAHSL
jgi:hypothetical protein